MKRATPALLLAAACGSVVPDEVCSLDRVSMPVYSGAHYDASSCSGAWPATHLSHALHGFEVEWEARFGPDDAVRRALNSVHIECVDHDWRTDEHLTSGIAWNGSNVKVSLFDSSDQCKPLPRASFVHEMIHIALMATTGNGDPDHDDGTRYGTEWTAEHSELEASVNVWLESSLGTPQRQAPDGRGQCFNPCTWGLAP